MRDNRVFVGDVEIKALRNTVRGNDLKDGDIVKYPGSQDHMAYIVVQLPGRKAIVTLSNGQHYTVEPSKTYVYVTEKVTILPARICSDAADDEIPL